MSKKSLKEIEAEKSIVTSHVRIPDSLTGQKVASAKSVSARDIEFLMTKLQEIVGEARDLIITDTGNQVEIKTKSIESLQSVFQSIDGLIFESKSTSICLSKESAKILVKHYQLETNNANTTSSTSYSNSSSTSVHAIKVNEDFFYRGNDIVKLWEQYLKALGTGIKFYIGVEDRSRESGVVDSIFSGLNQNKEITIVINKDGTPYQNKDGQTITLCGEINYTDSQLSLASASASSSSSVSAGVNSISQRIHGVMEQIKAYNNDPANVTKITNHIVIFPYHAGPLHWNLGQIELGLNPKDSTLIKASINIYEPFGGQASGYNGLIESINQLDVFKSVKIEQKKTSVPHIKQQHDSSSCGAITAENGKEFLKSQRDANNLLDKSYPKGANDLRKAHIQEIRDEAFFIAQRDNKVYVAKGDQPLGEQSSTTKLLEDLISKPDNDWIKQVITQIRITQDDTISRDSLDLFKQFLIRLDLSDNTATTSTKLSSLILTSNGSFKEGAIDLIKGLKYTQTVIDTKSKASDGSTQITLSTTTTSTKAEEKVKLSSSAATTSTASTTGTTVATTSTTTSSSSVPSTSSTADLSQLSDRLKALYRVQDTLPKLIEDTSVPEQKMDDYYVKLQIVLSSSKNGTDKQSIELEQIFDKVEDQKATGKVLVIGNAGIGKTTLLHNISYQWGNGNIFTDKFDYIFKVKLKKLLDEEVRSTLTALNKEDRLAKLIEMSIEDQQAELKAKYRKMSDDDLQAALARNGMSIADKNEMLKDIDVTQVNSALQGRALLLLDGYDEITHLDRQGSVVYHIMQKIYESQVVVTSRPNAISSDKAGEFGRKIETTGLNQEGAESYIHKYFTKQQAASSQAVDSFYVSFPKVTGDEVMLQMQSYFKKQKKPEIYRSIKEILTTRHPELTQESIKLSIAGHYQATEEALKSLLSNNPSLREVVTTPINVSMLCLISSDPKSMEKFQGDFNAGTLYQEAIFWLGKRYEHKYENINIKDLTINGVFDLKELVALKNIAYEEFSHGRVIIKGATIEEYSRPHGGIRKVNEFGLLKPENASNVDSEADSDEEVESDDLINRDHSFIHLSFQEYLTAHLLKGRLIDSNEQKMREVATFIAHHRNEPKYLMTLKFLAGLVNNHQYDSKDEEQTNQATLLVTRFWEAVTCNVDGVLELGIETKVALLMHLLGQAKIKGQLDHRIPNLETIKQLIDVIVLKDITKWGEQILQSGYVSDKIVAALISIMKQKENADIISVTEELNSSSSTKEQIKDEDHEVTNKNLELKVVAEIVTSFVNNSTFGIDRREVIFKYLMSLVKSKDWQLQKTGLEKLKQIIDQTIKKDLLQECVDLITPIVIDKNLSSSAISSLVVLIKLEPNYAEKVLDYLMTPIQTPLNENENVGRIRIICAKAISEVLKVMPISTVFELLNQLLEKSKSYNTAKMAVAWIFSEIAKTTPDIADRGFEVLKEMLIDPNEHYRVKYDVLFCLPAIVKAKPSLVWESLEVSKSIISGMAINKCDTTSSKQSLREVMATIPAGDVKLLKKLLMDTKADDDIKQIALDTIAQAVKAMPSKATQAFDTLKEILKDPTVSYSLKELLINSLLKITTVLNAEIFFDFLMKVLLDPNSGNDVKELIVNTLIVVIKEIPAEKHSKVLNEIMTLNSYDDFKIAITWILVNTLEIMPSMAEQVFVTLNGLLLDSSSENKNNVGAMFVLSLPTVVKAIPSLTPEVLESIKGLISDPESDSNLMEEIASSLSKIMAAVPGVIKYTFEMLKQVLIHPKVNNNVNTIVVRSLSTVVKAMPSLTPGVLELIKGLMSDSESDSSLIEVIASSLSTIMKTVPSTAEHTFEVLKQVLIHPKINNKAKKTVLYCLQETVETVPSVALEIFKLLKEMLTNLNFSNADEGVLLRAIYCLKEVVKAIPNIAREALEILNVVIANDDAKQSYPESSVLAAIVTANPSLAGEAFETLKGLFTCPNTTGSTKQAIALLLPVLVKYMPSITEEVLEMLKWLLAYPDSSESNKLSAIGNLSGVVTVGKINPSIIFEILKGILVDPNTSYDIKRQAASSLEYVLKAMPSMAEEVLTLFKVLLINPNFKLMDISDIVIEHLPMVVRVLPTTVNEVFKVVKELPKIASDSVVRTDNLMFTRVVHCAEYVMEDMSLNKIVNLLTDSDIEVRNIAHRLILKKLKNPAEVSKIMDYPLIISLSTIISTTQDLEEAIDKELNLAAKKVLKVVLTNIIDKIGIKWFNEHFADLQNSSETKSFLKDIYHKALSYEELTQSTSEFIIKCIMSGLTTTVTRSGKIIFEGNTYSLSEANKVHLGNITKVALNQEQDLLAQQYRNHKPLFSNTGSGLPIAASDIPEVPSLVNSLQINVADHWNLSLLSVSSNASDQFIILERRSEFGDLVIYKVTSNGNTTKLESHPGKVDREFREEIFGQIEYVTYSVKSLELSTAKVEELFLPAQVLSGSTVSSSSSNASNSSSSSPATLPASKQSNLFEALILKMIEEEQSQASSSSHQGGKFIEKWQLLGLNDNAEEVKLIKVQEQQLEHEQQLVEHSEQLSKHEQRLKLHGTVITDTKVALNLLECVTEKLQEDVTEDKKLTAQQKTEIAGEIKLLEQSMRGVVGRVDAQEPVMQELTTDMKDLLIRKELDTKAFKTLREKVKGVEQRLDHQEEEQLKQEEQTVEQVHPVVAKENTNSSSSSDFVAMSHDGSKINPTTVVCSVMPSTSIITKNEPKIVHIMAKNSSGSNALGIVAVAEDVSNALLIDGKAQREEQLQQEVEVKPSARCGDCVVMVVNETKYDNPVLNYPDILRQFAKSYSNYGLNKLIDFGTQFTTSEDSDSLDEILSSENALSSLITLLGINVWEA